MFAGIKQDQDSPITWIKNISHLVHVWLFSPKPMPSISSTKNLQFVSPRCCYVNAEHLQTAISTKTNRTKIMRHWSWSCFAKVSKVSALHENARDVLTWKHHRSTSFSLWSPLPLQIAEHSIQFYWKNKKNSISLTTLQNRNSRGGLEAPNIHQYFLANQLQCLVKWSHRPNHSYPFNGTTSVRKYLCVRPALPPIVNLKNLKSVNSTLFPQLWLPGGKPPKTLVTRIQQVHPQHTLSLFHMRAKGNHTRLSFI